MTIEERVDSIYKWNNPALRAVVLETITAAVEAERERCAKIAEEAAPEFHHKEMREAAECIAGRIRAKNYH